MREGRVRLPQAFREEFGKRGVWNRENVSVGGFFAAFVQAHPGELTALEFQAANRST